MGHQDYIAEKANLALDTFDFKDMPITRNAILDSLQHHPMILSALTRQELIWVISALCHHWRLAVAWTEREACANGFIWDHVKQKTRDIND